MIFFLLHIGVTIACYVWVCWGDANWCECDAKRVDPDRPRRQAICLQQKKKKRGERYEQNKTKRNAPSNRSVFASCERGMLLKRKKEKNNTKKSRVFFVLSHPTEMRNTTTAQLITTACAFPNSPTYIFNPEMTRVISSCSAAAASID